MKLIKKSSITVPVPNISVGPRTRKVLTGPLTVVQVTKQKVGHVVSERQEVRQVVRDAKNLHKLASHENQWPAEFTGPEFDAVNAAFEDVMSRPFDDESADAFGDALGYVTAVNNWTLHIASLENEKLNKQVVKYLEALSEFTDAAMTKEQRKETDDLIKACGGDEAYVGGWLAAAAFAD